jgi:hypothetical protein
MAAAARRPAVLAFAAALLLAGCTYDTTEPGLFPSPQPPVERTVAPRERFKPRPTNPELPVFGERLWVSASSPLPITFRIAVHAVRRIERASVLDWSMTPIAAPGFAFGDSLPPSELGLEPATRPSLAMALLDPTAGVAYQPLTHRSRAEFNHCLCVPLLRLKPDLRLGETRLLQTAFPALPEPLAFVDVNLFTVTPVRHVPVSPIGTAPVARRPIDLARAGEVPQPGPAKIDFPNPSGSQQRQRIQVIGVRSAPGRATLEWTLTSLNHQGWTRVLEYEAPVTATPPEGVRLANVSPASGPVLRVGSSRLSTLWSRTERNNLTSYECQCTEIGLWAAGLRQGGVTVGLVTNYPALPSGTAAVDVEFPGFGTIRGVPVTEAEDAARNAGPSRPVETRQWVYSTEDYPYGWPTSDWPTDTPDTSDLAEYDGRVEPLVTLPAAR